MEQKNYFNVKSLKEHVYEYLRDEIHKNILKPGSMINMDETSKKLGISKTPLRDALIQLETEGFVSIIPRRGIYVNSLTIEDIKEYYQIIGALESSAIIQGATNINTSITNKMKQLNKEMHKAIEKDKFDEFYTLNLAFHNTFVHLSKNKNLINIVNNLKKRLYDFPSQTKWIKAWEDSSIGEHEHLTELLEQGKSEEAARYIHDVHWSFSTQENFIRTYYFGEDKSSPSI
jgi:DNA-binding GntR family transcriptional regulator